MWNLQQKRIFDMKKYANEESSQKFGLYTDSNLATLNRAAEYSMFTGVKSVFLATTVPFQSLFRDSGPI
jgi:hypothetical protein